MSVVAPELRSHPLERNLREMERSREAYWSRYPATSPTRLRWRANTVRHWFHVLPGESILELGAGAGQWTAHLVEVLRGENPITAMVFSDDLAARARARNLPNTTVHLVEDRIDELPADSFDYVVGTAILCHDRYAENLRELHRLLKPGGRLLFFEANYWNPQVLVKSTVPSIGRWAGNARCQIGMRRFRLAQVCSAQGYVDVETVPYDIVHPRTPKRLVHKLQSVAFLLEHAPVVKEACGTLYIAARKPGDETTRRPPARLTPHRRLDGTTSVVVPCRNEEPNIPALVRALRDTYDEYLTEIIIVNDGSDDATAETTRAVAREEPRVRLIDRVPPHGVGGALRDGYAAAGGRYILSMDCDFRLIVPELRDLFDVVAEGADGAIGSRFSRDSVLVNYPFIKILANRSFHLAVRLLLRLPVRDVSNNLKLYRGDILRELQITRPDFAANVETGLKPILAGYDIREVPISWIDRTTDMGTSSFRLARLAPSYVLALLELLGTHHRPPRRPAAGRAGAPAARPRLP